MRVSESMEETNYMDVFGIPFHHTEDKHIEDAKERTKKYLTKLRLLEKEESCCDIQQLLIRFLMCQYIFLERKRISREAILDQSEAIRRFRND